MINSPADDLAFERIVNVPKRGLGDATVQMLHDHARKRRIPLFEAARAVVETDELKPKARGSLRDLIASFDRWRAQREVTSHTEMAEIVLDESGYTEMWQKDRSADAAGRLDNLKELVRSMEEFENLQGFLEHISLVMDRDGGADDDAVSLMTLHSAKGLEFDNVFLPGWEEGLFPSQRTLDEQGRAGLEEERRLAHVGLTRARRRAKLYFATNRRIHGTWSTTIPSRFLDELPAHNVEITESKGGSGWGGSGGYGPSRFDNVESFGSSYTTPGWQRAQANRARGQGGRNGQAGGGFNESQSPFSGSRSDASSRGGDFARNKRGPMTIEGELIAKSTGTISEFNLDDRVFHQKFGYGHVVKIDTGQPRPRPGRPPRKRPRPGRRRLQRKPVAILRLARRYFFTRRLHAQQARTDDDRGRADRQIHRHHFGIQSRRPGVSPEIRLRPRGEDRRQQAHHRLREGRREEGGR